MTREPDLGESVPYFRSSSLLIKDNARTDENSGDKKGKTPLRPRELNADHVLEIFATVPVISLIKKRTKRAKRISTHITAATLRSRRDKML